MKNPFKLLLLLMLFSSLAFAAPPTTDVNVINTPSVNANQQGAWSVAVDSVPPVTIGNPASSPVPVVITADNTKGTPVQILLGGIFEAGNTTLSPRTDIPVSPLYLVPVGKRLYIHDVSCSGAVMEGGEIDVSLNTQFLVPEGTTPYTSLLTVVMTRVLTHNGYDQYRGHQQVSTFIDDNVTTIRTLQIGAQRSGPTTLHTGLLCRITGELADL